MTTDQVCEDNLLVWTVDAPNTEGTLLPHGVRSWTMKVGRRPCPESRLGVPGTRWVIWCHYDTVALTASKDVFEPDEMTGACRRGFVQENTRFIDSWDFKTGGSETQTLLELAINMQDTRVQIGCSLYCRRILLAQNGTCYTSKHPKLSQLRTTQDQS